MGKQCSEAGLPAGFAASMRDTTESFIRTPAAFCYTSGIFIALIGGGEEEKGHADFPIQGGLLLAETAYPPSIRSCVLPADPSMSTSCIPEDIRVTSPS